MHASFDRQGTGMTWKCDGEKEDVSFPLENGGLASFFYVYVKIMKEFYLFLDKISLSCYNQIGKPRFHRQTTKTNDEKEYGNG